MNSCIEPDAMHGRNKHRRADRADVNIRYFNQEGMQ
jgi:hypothetical protein